MKKYIFLAIRGCYWSFSDSLKIGWSDVIAADKMLYYYTLRGEQKRISYNEG